MAGPDGHHPTSTGFRRLPEVSEGEAPPEVQAVFGSTEKSFAWSFRVAQDDLFPLRVSH